LSNENLHFSVSIWAICFRYGIVMLCVNCLGGVLRPEC